MSCEICGKPGKLVMGHVYCKECAEICARILEICEHGATVKSVLEKLREN